MWIISRPLGLLLNFIYGIIANYGWSLVVFTLAVKIILLPLSLKQQKSMTKMQLVQPRMNELQEKYGNDRQKLSEETMKLYKEYNISPMGGCLPMLIQLPVLFGLYYVIREPLAYMFGFAIEKIWELQAVYNIFPYGVTTQIDIAKAAYVAQAEGAINFDFLGLDLAGIPSFANNLWIIPVIAGATTFLSSAVTNWINGKDKKKDEPAKPQRVLNPEAKQPANTQSTMKTMTYIMPIMTGWIAFSFPAALGLYWAISNVLSVAQTVVLNGYYAKKIKNEFVECEERRALEREEKMKRRKRGH